MPAQRMATSQEELRELFLLCRQGRLYEVEAWIKDGRPLQLHPSVASKLWRRQSAVRIAIMTGQHSLVMLLLSNGYQPDAEPESPFDAAMEARRWDLVDLLFERGA